MTSVRVQVDGRPIEVPEGATILRACEQAGVDTPTLCYLETLTPVNVCRVCVVEVEGSRVLAPACSRQVESGMKIATRSDRVRHSRRLVLEFLASSVDLSLVSEDVKRWMEEYEAEPARFGPYHPGGRCPDPLQAQAAQRSTAKGGKIPQDGR